MTLSVKRNLLSFPWNDITLCNIPWMDLPTHAHGTICLSPLSNVCCSIWDLFQPKQVPIELWFSWWSKWTANTGFSAVLQLCTDVPGSYFVLSDQCSTLSTQFVFALMWPWNSAISAGPPGTAVAATGSAMWSTATCKSWPGWLTQWMLLLQHKRHDCDMHNNVLCFCCCCWSRTLGDSDCLSLLAHCFFSIIFWNTDHTDWAIITVCDVACCQCCFFPFFVVFPSWFLCFLLSLNIIVLKLIGLNHSIKEISHQ